VDYDNNNNADVAVLVLLLNRDNDNAFAAPVRTGFEVPKCFVACSFYAIAGHDLRSSTNRLLNRLPSP
jgi:hypothetical protein